MGSAPTLNQTNKGIDDRSIKLGCVQPGESPATFGDALRRLATKATYLVEDHGQYWYSLGQTIGRTAADRAQSRFLEEHADEELTEAARSYLAWKSILDEHEELNLDAQQRRHAETQRKHFDEAVDQRLGETFIWLLTPRQDPGSGDVKWEQSRVTGGDPIPVR